MTEYVLTITAEAEVTHAEPATEDQPEQGTDDTEESK